MTFQDGVVASAQPDPIFAAIKNLRQVELAIDDESPDVSLDDYEKTKFEFFQTVPTTPSGVVAFAGYLHEAQVRMCGANPYIDDVEHAEVFAATLDLAVKQLARYAPTTEFDPIFVAIEKHRAAWNEFNSKTSALDEAGTAEAAAECERLRGEVESDEYGLVVEMPTTREGAIALLRYVADMGEAVLSSKYDGPNGSEYFVHIIQRNVAKALSGMST